MCILRALTLALLLPAILFFAGIDETLAQCNGCGRYQIVDRTKQVSAAGCPAGRTWYLVSNYCCSDGTYQGTATNVRTECIAACDGSLSPDCNIGQPTGGCTWAAGTCTAGQPDPEETCDGQDGDGDNVADEGCLDGACSRIDESEHPVRFSSGHVETRVISPLALPAPVDVPFGVFLRWGSHQGHKPVGFNAAGPRPINFDFQTNHFMGLGWLDAYSDRLYIHKPRAGTSIPENPGVIDWQSFKGSHRFFIESLGPPFSRYVTTARDYELRDYGATASPRYRVIRTRELKVWEFSDITFSSSGLPGRVGKLTRIAIPANEIDFSGGYGVTIDSDVNGTISSVVDTFGRRLLFSHSTTGFHRVTAVSYQESSGSLPVKAVDFDYLDEPEGPLPSESHHDLLEKIITSADFGANYVRFLYWHGYSASTCLDCYGLLRQVIRPTTYPLAPPSAYLAVTAGEMITEGHEYYESSPEARRPRARLDFGPNRRWAYSYSQCVGNSCNTRQFDLQQPGGVCSAGCATDFDCYSASIGGDNVCYRYVDHNYFQQQRTVTAVFGTSSHTNGTSYGGQTVLGVPTVVTGGDGRRNTFSFDNQHRLVCMVTNDDDDVAGTNPALCDASTYPDSSWVGFDRNDLTTTVRSLGRLSSILTRTLVRDARGNVLSEATTGMTRNVNGVTNIAQTHTITKTYTSFGAIDTVDGPQPNALAYDLVDYNYDALGRLSEIRTRVGTAASFYDLVTRYDQYDASGVPHRITDASGMAISLNTSDRIVWDVVVNGGTWKFVLNPTGTVRNTVDADGVCTTFEYSSTGPSDKPIHIKRSANTNSACGSIPINLATGEVEIRTYILGDRLASVQRRRDNVIYFSETYGYNPARRLDSVASPSSANPATATYAGGILTQVMDSMCTGGSGPLCGRIDYGVDGMGRPVSFRRYRTSSSYTQSTLGYASGAHFLPTTISRGNAGAGVVTSTYVYDDFGQLIQSTTPNAGTVRYQYDLAGNLVRERVGVGQVAPLDRTSILSYDSLGRLLSVDHDIERPVNCATAAAGTPIMDEQYRYDSCDSTDLPVGAICNNAMGKMTLARSILSCNGSKAAVSRGTWFSYDAFGRLSKTQIAYRDNAGFGALQTFSVNHTLSGRVSQRSTNLLGGTLPAENYLYRGADGQLASVTLTGIGNVYSAVSYRPFGPVDQFRVYSNTGPATVSNAFDQRYLPVSRNYGSVTFGATYDGAGFLTSQTSSLAGHSRFFLRDALGRLTCETTTSVTACPTSATAPNLRGRYLFNNGTSASTPPDTRGQVVQQMPGVYTPGVAESSVYAPNSEKLLQMARTGGSTTFAYDRLGRRVSDEDVFSPSSRRTYAYLPNGRLGTISGTTAGGKPYTVSLQYDTAGRPFSQVVTVGGAPVLSYEYYYDENSNLIHARENGNHWRYFYANGERVGAQRGSSAAGRFNFLNDLRGNTRVVRDTANATVFRADYLASGWRRVEIQTANTYFPFALENQIVLGTTEAKASGTYNFIRPPIHLNGVREYDPFTGGFLQPDPLDSGPRRWPEAYLYGRGNATQYVDAGGIASFNIHRSKKKPPNPALAPRWRGLQFARRLDRIAEKIQNCDAPDCYWAVVSKKEVIHQTLEGEYELFDYGAETGWRQLSISEDPNFQTYYFEDAYAYTKGATVHLPPRVNTPGSASGCNKDSVIFHEILHAALYNKRIEISSNSPDFIVGWIRFDLPYDESEDPDTDSEHKFINSLVRKCYGCEFFDQ